MGVAIPWDCVNVLNQADIERLCEEAQQKGEVIYQQTGSEILFNLPQKIGRGGEAETHLGNGITLVTRNMELWQSVKLGKSPLSVTASNFQVSFVRQFQSVDT